MTELTLIAAAAGCALCLLLTCNTAASQTRSVPLGNADSEWLLGQARAKNLPVVVMSGSGAAGEAMQFIEKGALDYLERPVSLPKLRNIWQHVVRKVRWLALPSKGLLLQVHFFTFLPLVGTTCVYICRRYLHQHPGAVFYSTAGVSPCLLITSVARPTYADSEH